MSELLPFFLNEAVVSLYPVGSDDLPLYDEAVWSGAVANGLRSSLEYEEQVVQGAGQAYGRAHHVDERHEITIERTWVLRRSAIGSDFVPGRNVRYALEVIWAETPGGGPPVLARPTYWYRRTYFGVTARSARWESERTNEFGAPQVWRAERFVSEGDEGTPPSGIYTPLPGAEDSTEQSVGFFRENVLITGEYLLGHYRWAVPVSLMSARAIAFAPQVTAVTLELEVNGVLTGKQIVLAVGPANTEVVGNIASIGLSVPAGQSVRWQVVGAPAAPEDSAWVCAVSLQVQP